MARQYSSFGGRYSRDYNRGYRDASEPLFGGPSGGSGGGGTGDGCFAVVAIFILSHIREIMIIAGVGGAVAACFWAAYTFIPPSWWHWIKSYCWPELSLEESAPGILSELAAQQARWITPPEPGSTPPALHDHAQGVPPTSVDLKFTADPQAEAIPAQSDALTVEDTDVFVPEDRLYQRFDESSLRSEAAFHWRRGRIFRFIVLTNKDARPSADLQQSSKKNATGRSTRQRTQERASNFAGMPPILPFLDGCTFHALTGAITGLLSTVAGAYLYLTILSNPNSSIAGLIPALLGCVLGIVFAAISRTFPRGSTTTNLSGALNGAANGFLGGYIAYDFFLTGHRGSDSMYGLVFAINTTLGGVFCLSDWLFSHSPSKGDRATVRAALFSGTVLAFFVKMAEINPQSGFWAWAFILAALLAFVSGIAALVVRPLGIFTGLLAGWLGGFLGTAICGSPEISKFRPAFESLLSHFPGVAPVAIVGLGIGIFLSLFNYCRHAFFLPKELNSSAFVRRFLSKIPQPIRTLALTAKAQFEELEVICDYRASAIANNSRDDLSRFEFLLLGRTGNNRWLIAIFRPTQKTTD
jgi:hypothetical protein